MRVALGLAVLVAACAHRLEPQLTAGEHRDEAALHLAAADAERGKYDPAAVQRWNGRAYNPSEQHLVAADRELSAAADHLRLARALERFEDASCQKIPPAERAACPLFASSVARVREGPTGVSLALKPGVDAVAAFRRLDCHLAYAQAEGFDRPSCPLFVRGMSLELEFDHGEKSIALVAEDPAVAERLRAHARRIFGGAAE